MKNLQTEGGKSPAKPSKVWTVGRRVTLGFAAVLLTASVVGTLAWIGLSSIRQSAEQITRDTLPTYRAINLIGILNRDNFILAQRYAMTSDKELRAKLAAEMKANSEVMAGHLTAYEKLADSPDEKKVFEAIKALRTPYIDARKEMIALSDKGQSAEASAVVETKLFPAFDSYAAKIREAMEVTEKLSNRDGSAILANVAFADRSILIGAVVALVLGVSISALISKSVTSILRRVSGRLEEGSAQVSSAASQVSDASNTLASSASEQAASLEETSASLEEIASMTRRNAENARAAKDLANHTRSAAESGAGDMGEMSRAMDDVKVASSNISKIIKTIDEIAFQTNILALNAAVEAARAGEAGAGFAVVAEEVRNLAQRSAMAARETASSIEDAIGKSQRAVEISTRVGSQLDQIVTKAREVDAIVGEIAGASLEQDQGISQITKAVTHMDTTTQSNAATSEESAAAAAELSSQAKLLLTAVDELLALSGGSGKTRPEKESQSASSSSPAAKPASRIQPPPPPREIQPAVSTHSTETVGKTGAQDVSKDFFNF